MRPGQNRRLRGRTRNKGPNPLTRTYESNGPDVKIRGTAQHVADKYAQLARDAHASGDPVSAESYFQHAEHYYRMIAAAQEQFRQQYGGFQRPFDEDGEEGDEEGGFGMPGVPGQQPQGPSDEFGDMQGYGGNGGYEPRGGAIDRPPQHGQQQRFDRNDRGPNRPQQQRFDRHNGGDGRYERAPQDRGHQDRPSQQDRGAPDRAPQQDRGGQGGGQDRGFPDRGGQDRGPADRSQFDRQNGAEPRADRPNGERYDRGQGGERNDRRERYGREGGQREPHLPREARPDRDARPERDNRPERDMRPERQDRQPTPYRPDPRGESEEERVPAAGTLPAFLTNPVRPAITVESDAGDRTSGAAPEMAQEAPLNGIKTRRRRVRKAEAPEGGDVAEGSDSPAE